MTNSARPRKDTQRKRGQFTYSWHPIFPMRIPFSLEPFIDKFRYKNVEFLRSGWCRKINKIKFPELFYNWINPRGVNKSG